MLQALLTAVKQKTGAERPLFAGEDLRHRIHEANITVHRFEAEHYELLHPEVFDKQEQRRLGSTLKTADRLIAGNQRKALDVGAGTGNLTGKLLDMDYTVTAIDISAEMCEILKRKYKEFLTSEKLVVLNVPIEDVSFGNGEFDLITCYSVLHHLPDYANVLQRLSVFLKKGGVMYLDHEASPLYWKNEPNALANLIKNLYFHSNPLINVLYFRMIGLKVPSLDYTLSDYWHKNEHPLNHAKIRQVFEKEKYPYFTRIDYHLKRTWVSNPLFYIYKHTCRPEMSLWIAKK